MSRQLTRMSMTASVSPRAPAPCGPRLAMPLRETGVLSGWSAPGGPTAPWDSAHPSGCDHSPPARDWSVMRRSISIRLRVYPASERWWVARMYARRPRASRSSSGSPATGHHPSPPPGEGQPSSYRVSMLMPRWDRNASCSERPRALDVESPRRAMSMRRDVRDTPRSYASVATSANSCAAKRDPRRSARKLTWSRDRSSAVSSPEGGGASSSDDEARGTTTRDPRETDARRSRTKGGDRTPTHARGTARAHMVATRISPARPRLTPSSSGIQLEENAVGVLRRATSESRD